VERYRVRNPQSEIGRTMRSAQDRAQGHFVRNRTVQGYSLNAREYANTLPTSVAVGSSSHVGQSSTLVKRSDQAQQQRVEAAPDVDAASR
jgi:hypothetical protein